MSEEMINQSPYQRLEFAKKMISKEEELQKIVHRMEQHLDEAQSVLPDEKSQEAIAIMKDMISELKKNLDGSITEIAMKESAKAHGLITTMEKDFYRDKFGIS